MYRMVDCGTWDDPWFAELEPAAKLLFLYLLTNRRTTPAGCFEITVRAICFETGLAPERVNALLPSFGDRVCWWADEQVIWVKNFYRRQMGDSASNPKFREGARRALAKFPAVVRETVSREYPELRPVEDAPTVPVVPESKGHARGIHTPSEPLPKRVVTDTDTETEQIEPTARGDFAATEDRSDGMVYALVDAYAVGKGINKDDLAGSARQKAFRSLQSAPPWATSEDVSSCTAYLMSDPFWQGPGKLQAQKVVETLPEWRTKGKPKRHVPTKPTPINRNGAAPPSSGVVTRADRDQQKAMIGRD